MNDAELRHIIQKLSFDLIDAKLEQIADFKNIIRLGFENIVHNTNKRFFIIIDFNPDHLDIYPTSKPQKAPAVPQAFTMLLRKSIAGKKLCSLHIAPDDRIVTFEFGKSESPDYALIAELTGRAPKIFFINAQNFQILGRIAQDRDRNIHDTYTRPLPPPSPDLRPDRFADIPDDQFYDAVESDCCARHEKSCFLQLQTETEKKLRKSITRTRNRLSAFHRDLDRITHAQDERKHADILNAYAYQIKQGSSCVELPDFETGALVAIPLNPALSVRDNIDKKYNHAKRLIKALPDLQIRIQDAQARLDALQTLLQQVNLTNDVPSLQHLLVNVDDLCTQDDKKIRANAHTVKNPSARSKKDTHVPFKTFFSADNTKILVGKSARDNIELTFKYARGNDTWLHACGVSGSHVIIKSAAPSQETLLDAALLAMHYARVSKADAAEIQVTQVKFLKKIKDDAIGKVEVHGEHALYVRRDDARLKRLMATELN